jgi:MFS family permease
MANGVVLSSTNALIARWIPTMERGRATSTIIAGSLLGAVIVLPVAGVLCDSSFIDGWPSTFYLLGIAGCVWFGFWTLLIHESPDSHPHISEAEYTLIITGQGEEKAAQVCDYFFS